MSREKSIIDEVWAEEGSIAIRVHHAVGDKRRVEIVQYVKADHATAIGAATIMYGRLGRLARALWPSADDRPGAIYTKQDAEGLVEMATTAMKNLLADATRALVDTDNAAEKVLAHHKKMASRITAPYGRAVYEAIEAFGDDWRAAFKRAQNGKA